MERSRWENQPAHLLRVLFALDVSLAVSGVIFLLAAIVHLYVSLSIVKQPSYTFFHMQYELQCMADSHSLVWLEGIGEGSHYATYEHLER